jgi:N-[(2S)-2-amino-2-carboxyethyl]-L-glutamate dehydrogenase
MTRHDIHCRYFSQEDLLGAGCLDIHMAMNAAEWGMLQFQAGKVLFPDKIVQIFNDETQERINCLPATFTGRKICGVKWVSVFPPNPVKHGVQNLSAVIILSEIEHGFPIAFMEGTLCSNIRVGSMVGIAAKPLARLGGDWIHRRRRAGEDASDRNENSRAITDGLPGRGEA